MSFVRLYRMTARSGEEQALSDALGALAGKVRALEGNAGVELYRDMANPPCFTFLERWASAAAHEAGGRLLGKEAFAPIMALLAAPPEAASLEQQPIS